jgi:uncharacterized coiled-coil protein SlyX
MDDDVEDDDEDDSIYTGQTKGKGKVEQSEPTSAALLDVDEEESDDEDFQPHDEDDEDDDEDNEQDDREAMQSLVEDDGDDPHVLYKDMTKNVETVLTEIADNQIIQSNASVGSVGGALEHDDNTNDEDISVDDFLAQMTTQTPSKTTNPTPTKTPSQPPKTPAETPKKAAASTPTSTPKASAPVASGGDDVDDFFASMVNDSQAGRITNVDTPSKALEAKTITPVKETVTPQKDILKEKTSRLDALMQKLQGKKETTIKQSQRDWNKFKEEKGLEDELKNASQQGYLDKQAFLTRTEMKQFEQDSELRNQERERQRWEGK